MVKQFELYRQSIEGRGSEVTLRLNKNPLVKLLQKGFSKILYYLFPRVPQGIQMTPKKLPSFTKRGNTQHLIL